MSVVLLHLSDLHARDPKNEVLARGRKLAASIYPLLSTADGVLIVFSGDIAYSGKKHEYELATEFLFSVIDAIRTEKDLPIHLFAAPGNHDCDLSGNQDVRSVLIESIRRVSADDISSAVIAQCATVQAEFFAFQRLISDLPDVDGESSKDCDPLWTKLEIDLRGQKIVIDLINVAWMSTINEQPNLQFPVVRYSHLREGNQDLRIAVMHHPLNWYHQSSYRPFRQLIRSSADIVLTGHEHHPNIGENDDLETGISVYLEGGVLNDPKSDESTYNVLEIDIPAGRYKANRYSWDGSKYIPDENSTDWSDFRQLTTIASAKLPLLKEFESQLDDPGAQLVRRGKSQIALDDFFVYPYIRKIANDEFQSIAHTSEKLTEISKIEQGVILTGDEKSGRTSLLFRLYRSYHSQGKLPIFIDGRRIASANPSSISKLLANAIKEQYGESALIEIQQLPKSDKVLLLDNLDSARLTSPQIVSAISILAENFAGAVLTAGLEFELSEILYRSTLGSKDRFQEYRILEFGHALRYDLACRWAGLNEIPSAAVANSVAIIDHCEKVLTSVVGRNLVPSYPFYLLILLQSIDAGQQATLQNSAYGHYYQYLITHALSEYIRPAELEEFFHYCAQLAWFYQSSKRKQLDRRTLSNFHNAYCEKFVYVDFEKRLHHLLTSRMLMEIEESYSFRYPYSYFFFLGKYLAENLSDSRIRHQVSEYCADLSQRENANAVLFLAHHSKETFVYERVAEQLNSIFDTVASMNFDDDVTLVNELIDSAPRLVFEDLESEDSRRKVREIQDRDGPSDDDPGVPEEELPNKNSEQDKLIETVQSLIKLMKTAEILGQILKNHYGPLRRNVKEELLETIFRGILRGLRHFFDILIDDTGILVSDIEASLDEEAQELPSAERANAAKRAAFLLLEMISYGFIRKAAVCVGSDYLRDVIADTVRKDGSTAFRLIQLGVELDSPRQMPVDDIRKLDKELKSNPFARRLVRILVVRYMYMFRTTEKQKQQLCAEFGIEIQKQHQISFTAHPSMKLLGR